MAAQTPNRTSTQAPPSKRAERQHARSAERGHGSPSLFNLDTPTDLPTAILGLQASSGNRAVTNLLNNSEPDSEHAASGANNIPDSVQSILKSDGGRPLEPAIRAFMESRFHHDFSDVRIHDNDSAAQSAGELNAAAYTAGQNIVLNSGRYAPETPGGIQLLAHELAHVVQQGGADSGPLEMGRPGDVAEVEASGAADAVVSNAQAPSINHSDGGTVVRCAPPPPSPGLLRRSPGMTDEEMLKVLERFPPGPPVTLYHADAEGGILKLIQNRKQYFTMELRDPEFWLATDIMSRTNFKGGKGLDRIIAFKVDRRFVQLMAEQAQRQKQAPKIERFFEKFFELATGEPVPMSVPMWTTEGGGKGTRMPEPHFNLGARFHAGSRHMLQLFRLSILDISHYSLENGKLVLKENIYPGPGGGAQPQGGGPGRPVESAVEEGEMLGRRRNDREKKPSKKQIQRQRGKAEMKRRAQQESLTPEVETPAVKGAKQPPAAKPVQSRQTEAPPPAKQALAEPTVSGTSAGKRPVSEGAKISEPAKAPAPPPSIRAEPQGGTPARPGLTETVGSPNLPGGRPMVPGRQIVEQSTNPISEAGGAAVQMIYAGQVKQISEQEEMAAEAALEDAMETIEDLRRRGNWIVVNRVTKEPRQVDLLKGFFTDKNQISEFVQLIIGWGPTLDRARANVKNRRKFFTVPKRPRQTPLKEHQQYEEAEYSSYEPYPKFDVKTARFPEWFYRPHGLPGTYLPGAVNPKFYSGDGPELRDIYQLLSNRMLTIDASGSSFRAEMLDVESNTYYRTQIISGDAAKETLKAVFVHAQNGYLIESAFEFIGGTPERIRESFRAGNSSSLNVEGEHILEKR